ncbi:hypothetical protein [Corynebacterium sp.]|uniref:hypothetical protein n=1 Tax=Corynebacterium sp. TaxID=1720 RepID=UPI0019CA6517|nr:hypothetical protein [Corynebacterium sp.]HHU67811.1 hypothetical protein [Corynebacterium sp.]
MRDWSSDIEFIRMRTHRAGTPSFRRELRAGEFQLLCPEIAVPAAAFEAFPPWEQQAIRAFAVGLGSRKAVLVGKSAARLHGIPVLGFTEATSIVLPGGGRPPVRQWPAGVQYRRALLPEEQYTDQHGVRVTRIIRTVVDMCRYHGLVDGIVAFDHVLAMPSMSRGRAGAMLDDLGRIRGLGTARRALELADPRAESPLESWARAQILIAELPEVTSVEPQVEVLGGEHRVDLMVNGFLVVETDGELKYDGSTGVAPAEQMRRDRQRDRALSNAGIPRMHVTHADLATVIHGESRFLRMLRETLAALARQSA